MAKRLLLIAPVFFGYYKDIMEEARSLGFEVDYFCDAPSDSNVSKAFGLSLIHISEPTRP